MKKIILAILYTVVLVPISAQTKAEKKEIKEKKAAEEYNATKELINSGNYIFEATWANTLNGRRIDLTTNPNLLKLEGENADIYLPYFGEVHTPMAPPGGDGGVIFKGKVEGYKVDFNEKKQRVIIKFSGKAKNELFDFTLSVFKNGNGNLGVSSNFRKRISYDGQITALKKE
jgi:uncharacterized protein DUF4251